MPEHRHDVGVVKLSWALHQLFYWPQQSQYWIQKSIWKFCPGEGKTVLRSDVIECDVIIFYANSHQFPISWGKNMTKSCHKKLPSCIKIRKLWLSFKEDKCHMKLWLKPITSNTAVKNWFEICSSMNNLIHIYQILQVWSLSSSFKSKRWTAGMKYLVGLFLLFLLPSFIHSDPKWFHDLQPAENRAASQRVKTYCEPRSVLFHSHSSKLYSCIINTEHLCGELKFISLFHVLPHK